MARVTDYAEFAYRYYLSRRIATRQPMTAHRIDLLPPPKKHGRTLMHFNGKLISEVHGPIYASAR